MANRRRANRAARRRVKRTLENVARRERAVEAAAEEEPLLRAARHVGQLDHLLHRGEITIAMAQAGSRFARDYERSATIVGRLIGRYEADLIRLPKGQAPADTPHTIAARERFERACSELGILWAIVFHVAVCDLPPGSWAASPDRANGDAMALLRLGLAAAAQHYGLFSGATAARAGRPRHTTADRPAAPAASAPGPP